MAERQIVGYVYCTVQVVLCTAEPVPPTLHIVHSPWNHLLAGLPLARQDFFKRNNNKKLLI